MSPKTSQAPDPDPTQALIRVTNNLVRLVDELSFGPPITHVYNPLDYARKTYRAYVSRFAPLRPRALLLGMNPGPWGMAQTGVPFGDPVVVREWLGIDEKVGAPAKLHPKRNVLGFESPRREVSGQRLWGWAQQRYATPTKFFRRFFVLNYCPLAFMEESGRNRTPDHLPVGERAPLFEACDEALRRTVQILAPRWIIGVGKFAERQAIKAELGTGVKIASILHPSPASPAANRDWQGTVERQLRDIDPKLLPA